MEEVKFYALVLHKVFGRLEEIKRSCADQPETGGILIGSYRGPHLEIREISEAGPTDKRMLYSFCKQDPSHEKKAKDAWKASNFTETDIGEWHTHPYGRPDPSATDLRTWKRLVKENKRTMLFIILSPQGMGVYKVTEAWWGKGVIRLNLSEHGEIGVILY